MDYTQKIEEKRQKIVDTLIDFIEKNPAQWEAGWYSMPNMTPLNGKTQKKYNGLNAFYLCVISAMKGYKDPRWVTFNQAKDLGANVRAGEKSSEVFYWSYYDKETKQPYDAKTCEGMTYEERKKYWEDNVRPVIKFYQVFNAEQCDNMPEYELQSTPEMEAEERRRQNAVIEQIITNSAAPVNYDGGSRAYYSPSKDSIHLPEIKDFKTMQDYYATALHEIAHSTGHASRLNRDLSGLFGASNYAKEELRAELASVFMQVEFGISVEGRHFENHGAYLASWLKSVKNNQKEFFSAASDAEKITNYVADNYLNAKVESKEEQNSEDNAEIIRTARQQADASGKPYVEIEWSESPEIKNSTVLPFVEADAMLRAANEKERSLEGYYKTKLHIYYTDKSGEPGEYRDLRFDIGTETNGIIEHIEESVTTFTDENERNGIRAMLAILNAALEDTKTQNETTDNKEVPKFEANMSFAKQVDAVLSGADTASTHLKVMGTPLILRQLGAQNLPILMTAKHLRNIVAESGEDTSANYHGLEIDIVKQLPELLADPLIVMDSMTKPDSVVVITSAVDKNNRPILGAIKFDGFGRQDGKIIEANILASVYGKDNFENFIRRNVEAENVLYWSKEKSQDLSVNPGFQLPDVLASLDSNTIIRKAKAFVNSSEEKTEDFNKNSTEQRTVSPIYSDYLKTQKENPEAIVLKRVGDFYEVMGDKAAQVAATLDLTLTGRNVGLSDRVAMCGFPYHVADEYISKLRESSDVIVDDKYLVKRSTKSNDNANNESRQDEQSQQVGQVEQTLQDENTKQSNLYYPINEDAARRAKKANSLDDYIAGSATAEYQRYVDEAKRIADFHKTQVDVAYHEKIDRLLDTYARNLAKNMNARFDIDSRVPSVMISGAGNFPVRQKEKQNAAREKNWEEWKRISEIPEKISTIGMGGIQSSETNALEKLELKVIELEKSQETMKQINAYYRKNKTLDDCPYLPKEQLDELRAVMAKSWHGAVPFETFTLTNNNAEIKRIKSRIEELRKTKDGHYVGWEFDGGKVEANSKDMRLQIFFEEKPNSEKRAELKKAGFRWSPTVGSWQRQLNDNAIYAANGVKFIQPMNGESPSDLQRRVRAEKEILKEARNAAHEAGIPFSDKFYEGEDDFNPNVFDGSMSIEDYKLMNEMIDAEQVEQAQQVQQAEQVPVSLIEQIEEYAFESNNPNHLKKKIRYEDLVKVAEINGIDYASLKLDHTWNTDIDTAEMELQALKNNLAEARYLIEYYHGNYNQRTGDVGLWFYESELQKLSGKEYVVAEEKVLEQAKAAMPEQGKKPTVVNFYAGPGAGKTTAALELTAELKKAGLNVEYVSEYAKELVLEDKSELLSDQQHVTDEQYHRLDRLRNSVDVIVTDSPVLLGIVYGADRIDDAYRQKLRSYYDSFENIDIYLERRTVYDTKGRVQSEEEAVGLDKAISQMLEQQNIYCHGYSSDKISETVQLVELSQAEAQIADEKTQNNDIYGIVYNWKGLKEENSIYTANQLKELDKAFVQVEMYDGSFDANKTYSAFKLTGSSQDETLSNIRSFLTGKYNDSPMHEDWYWETVRTNLFTGEENATTNEYINRLNLKEKELRMSEQAQQTDTVEPVEQVGQAQQVQQVGQGKWNKIPLNADLIGSERGKSTQLKMPSGEYSSFVFFAPTKFVQHDEKSGAVQLSVNDNFKYTLMKGNQRVELTGSELRQAMVGQEVGKRAQRVLSEANAQTLTDIYRNVPEEMRQYPNWCVYRTRWNDDKGKYDKQIFSPVLGLNKDGKLQWASIDKPETWATFDVAMKFAEDNDCAGIVFALDGKTGISCIDLDKAIVKDGKLNDKKTDRAEGELSEIAARLSDELRDTYIETSASGNGLHIFVKDDLLAKGIYKNRAETPDGEIEVYDDRRFMSMTGKLRSNTQRIGKSPVATTNLIRGLLGKKVAENQNAVQPRQSRQIDTSDNAVIERIRKSKRGAEFEALYRGENVTGDSSRSDFKLLNMLAFFTDCDESQMERIFKNSGLYRENKGDAYLRRSISKACSTLQTRMSDRAFGGKGNNKGGNRGNSK